MPTPSNAVRFALTKLDDRKEFTLDEATDVAIEHLGEDEEHHRKAFLRLAMKRKVKDALRHSGVQQDERAENAEGDLLGRLGGKRVAVKRSDGEFVYRTFRDLHFSELKRHFDAMKKRHDAAGSDIPAMEELLRQISPLMAVNESLTVQEAVKMLEDNTQ